MQGCIELMALLSKIFGTITSAVFGSLNALIHHAIYRHSWPSAGVGNGAQALFRFGATAAPRVARHRRTPCGTVGVAYAPCIRPATSSNTWFKSFASLTLDGLKPAP